MLVLLTGGAGFIGSHVAVELVKAGYDVIIVDNYSNSIPDVVGRVEQIVGKKITNYRIDVADTNVLGQVFASHQIDAVIHLAGYKAVGESVTEPLKYYRNNLDTTFALLEVMHRYGVKKFIFSSSATVYGENNPIPYTEDMPAGGCTSPYGKSKYFIEEVLGDASFADESLSVVSLRYFNPIGAHESGLIGERPNGIPNNLMPYVTQAAAGIREKLSVYGNDYPTVDGTGVRDYIHVMDLARGHVAALNYANTHCGREVFNLGTGRGTSVLEMIKAFERANHVTIPYVIAPRRAGDLPEYYADVHKAERLLGWHAEKTVEDMCRDSWRWQQNCSSAKA